MKKLFLGILIVMLGTAYLYCTDNNFAQYNKNLLSNKIIGEEESIDVKTKEIKSKSKILEVDLKIPVIKGLKDKNIENKINEYFEKEALNLKNNIEKQSKEDYEKYKKEGYEFMPYSVNTEYAVNYNKGDLLSLSVTYGEFTGGNHGNYSKVSYNIDLKTGEQLKLKDLFKENSNYNNVISSKVKEQMNSEKSKYFEEEIQKFKSIKPDQDFYINNEGIVVYYQLYEIAPYANGIPEFKIPIALLKNELAIQIK